MFILSKAVAQTFMHILKIIAPGYPVVDVYIYLSILKHQANVFVAKHIKTVYLIDLELVLKRKEIG